AEAKQQPLPKPPHEKLQQTLNTAKTHQPYCKQLTNPPPEHEILPSPETAVNKHCKKPNTTSANITTKPPPNQPLNTTKATPPE
ncbi:hypothetical protein A2U01_0058441, partial [Trifolium medium]|nr:hypothetical protein [Trifolium medium]